MTCGALPGPTLRNDLNSGEMLVGNFTGSRTMCWMRLQAQDEGGHRGPGYSNGHGDVVVDGTGRAWRSVCPFPSCKERAPQTPYRSPVDGVGVEGRLALVQFVQDDA